MGKLTITCNSKQLNAITSDFEDATIPADITYGCLKNGKTTMTINYDDSDSNLVAAIVKYRLKDYETK